jgi:phosphoribosyl 1,2-cyclic phosphodiesterase/CheY-like chemotaxis protein
VRKRLLLADPDRGLLSIRSLRLRIEGYEVLEVADCAAAIRAMDGYAPDVLLLDPAIAGGEHLLRAIRSHRRYDGVKIVVNSAAASDAEQGYCRDLGADAFLAKPVEHDLLARTVRRLLRDEMTLTFWGTRGSLARPGIDTLKFGGNTPCVSVELTKDRFFIFDAGTGIADLGRALGQLQRRYRFNLFLSHPRWEHVQGLPFFLPLRHVGNDMVIHGPRTDAGGLRRALEAQAGHVCRPVVVEEFASRPVFRELDEGRHRIDGLQIDTIALNHPGRALGYRLQGESGQAVAYLAENEMAPGDARARRRVADFVAGADVLIHNASCFDHEYRYRSGRGGSPLTEVVNLAADAGVKQLYLFHHDPEHDDEAVTGMETLARGYFEDRGLDIQCAAAAEGATLRLEAPEAEEAAPLFNRPPAAATRELRPH